jgi:Met-zincin/Domain of unknown function (DUF5117)
MKRMPLFLTAALALALMGPALARADADDVSKDSKDKKNEAAAGAAAKPGESGGDEKPFDTVIKDMESMKGLFTFYRRAEDNKLLLELMPDQLDKIYLFSANVDRSTGERGFYAAQMGTDFPCVFHRVGKTIQWIQKNPQFTAAAGTPQARSTARSFPDAILAQVKILSKPNADRKSILIDVGDLFATRDLPGFAIGLNQAYAPTNFSFDKEKSSVTGAKVFPENALIDLTLHYTTDNPRTTTVTLADGRSVPITVKYGLSTLPETGYKPRLGDDRVGHFLAIQQDFTSDHPKTPYVRYITRWQLEKQDPNAALSPPKQPIVFWLENTIPVEYRDAVREGTLLWNKAFEKIGFKDAVVVKQQPDDADWDAADTRYSTIRWFAGVDATFAIGPSRANPYTGQIYDADISISEGIVRGARRLGEEYAGPVAMGADNEQATMPWSKDPQHQCSYAQGLADQAALGIAVLDSRGSLSPETEQKLVHEYIVELTAHEVGHTLGLRHNFRGSSILPANELNDVQKTETIGQSASVMDYNPVIIAGKGETQGHFVPITLGPYDYWAIEYAYTPMAGEEKDALAKIASRAADPMLPYSTDEDALGTYSALSIDPLANQYDQSTDPLAYFKERVQLVNELWANMEGKLAKPGDGYQIMRRALSRGLNDDFRSLVTSSKFVGGVYHVRDHVGDPDGRTPFRPVPAAKQREALDFLNTYAFSGKAFQLSPSLMNKLAIERIAGLDPAYYQVTRIDYPWHDNVLNVQRAVLNRLLHPVTLARIQDNELRFGGEEKPFKMAELFSSLNGSIWTELDGDASEITSLRRNLQREYLKQLVRLTLRQTPTMPAGVSGPAAAAALPPPEDATTLARYSLTRLQTKIRAKLAGKGALDQTTRAHLQESQARIDAALAAQMERGTD